MMRSVKTTLPIAAGAGAVVVLLVLVVLAAMDGTLDADLRWVLIVGGIVGIALAAGVGWGLGGVRWIAPARSTVRIQVAPPPPRPESTVESSLARISHEVRTPLNALLGYVELLQEDSVGEAASDLMRVRSAALQVFGIVTSALDLQRLNDGTYTMRPEILAMSELAREVGDSVRIEAEANANRLLVTADPILAPSLDRRMVRSILFNLAANACRYTANGTVTIEARAVGGRMHLVVTDSGIGMTERQIDELFGDGATVGQSRVASGPGYGVAVARGFTDVLGGRLTISSTPGKGTRVIVDLPTSVPSRGAMAD